MKMFGKVALILLAVLIAGSVMAGPAALQSDQNAANDTYYNVQSSVCENPPPVRATERDLEYRSSRTPGPVPPTPVYDWFSLILKATRMAD